MFENILGQNAVPLLAADTAAGRLAPSMLFRGPEASGKGSAALELARVLSCEGDGEWNCLCPYCVSHRLLQHQDILALGPRSFSPEIAAAARAFSRNSGDPAARILLIRSLRKLLMRFDSVLWEDDASAKKLSPLAENLDGDLNELLDFHGRTQDREDAEAEQGWTEKICASILENARRLESEGIPAQIPVAHIRRAAAWCRMSPLSARKLLLIENADRMRDEARNALLKILEEPPETAVIVLSSPKPAALLPTILSRLRPYYFTRREEKTEREVLRRVFRAGEFDAAGKTASGGSLVTAYLDSFLAAPPEKQEQLALFFTASLSEFSLFALKKKPAPLAALAEYAAERARNAGLPPAENAASCIRKALEEAGDFKAPGLFARFLAQVLETAGKGRRAFLERPPVPGETDADPGALAEIWSRAAASALQAFQANIAVSLILERFAEDFVRHTRVLYATM